MSGPFREELAQGMLCTKESRHLSSRTAQRWDRNNSQFNRGVESKFRERPGKGISLAAARLTPAQPVAVAAKPAATGLKFSSGGGNVSLR